MQGYRADLWRLLLLAFVSLVSTLLAACGGGQTAQISDAQLTATALVQSATDAAGSTNRGEQFHFTISGAAAYEMSSGTVQSAFVPAREWPNSGPLVTPNAPRTTHLPAQVTIAFIYETGERDGMTLVFYLPPDLPAGRYALFSLNTPPEDDSPAVSVSVTHLQPADGGGVTGEPFDAVVSGTLELQETGATISGRVVAMLENRFSDPPRRIELTGEFSNIPYPNQ